MNNYCASGSSALWLGRQAIPAGTAQCVLVFGFEQMARGAIGAVVNDRPDSLRRVHRGARTALRALFGAAGGAVLR